MRYLPVLCVLVVVCVLPAWALTVEQEAKLLPADGISHDRFGRSVTLYGDWAIIGAYLDNDNGWDSGSAYHFVRTNGVWTERYELVAFDGTPDDAFGWSLDLDGNTVIVGASRDDDNGYQSGSAYVFTRAWTPQAKLLASDGADQDFFGYDVALAGDTAMISAPLDDDNGAGSGSVYVFTRTNGVWTEQAKLTGPGFYFGRSAALSSNIALIGEQNGPGINPLSGAAHIFVRTGTTQWSERAHLYAADGWEYDRYGFSVSLSGDTVNRQSGRPREWRSLLALSYAAGMAGGTV